MPKVQYSEGAAAVTLPDGTLVERGQAVEVNADLAKQLEEQGWERVGGKKKKSSSTTGKAEAASGDTEEAG